AAGPRAHARHRGARRPAARVEGAHPRRAARPQRRAEPRAAAQRVRRGEARAAQPRGARGRARARAAPGRRRRRRRGARTLSPPAAAMPPPPALSIRNLTVEYRDRGRSVAALEDVSLEVPAGQTVAIIGRSGSGKTTLLRVLAGLQTPSAGVVEVCGQRVGRAERTPRARYRDVGILFQDHGVVGELTPLENVLCGRLLAYPTAGGLVRFRAEDRRRAAALLADFGLAARSGLRTAK